MFNIDKTTYTTEQLTLLLGDCLERMKEVESASIDCVITDLPYQITACKWDIIIPFEPMWAELHRVCKPNAPMIFTASQPFTSMLVMSNLKEFKVEWIWEKNRGSNFATAKYLPMKEHESVLVFSNGGGKTPYYPIKQERAEGGKARQKYDVNASNTGKRDTLNGMKATDLGKISELRVPRSIQKFNTEVGLHPTQKPVALLEYLVKTYTQEGETVLDFTAGVFSTGVACVKINRNFIGIEKDENYFNIGANRIKETIKCQN